MKDYLRREVAAMAGDPQNVQAIWNAVGRFAAQDRLHQITVPTQVLVGATFKQTHTQGRKMAAAIANARYGVIENAGHMLNWDNPEQFNREVLAFLARFEPIS